MGAQCVLQVYKCTCVLAALQFSAVYYRLVFFGVSNAGRSAEMYECINIRSAVQSNVLAQYCTVCALSVL